MTLELSGIDVPLDWDTTDVTPWAVEYEDARARWPERVATVEGTASWFAALMEVGRHHPNRDEVAANDFRNLMTELHAAQTRADRLQARVHELEAQLERARDR